MAGGGQSNAKLSHTAHREAAALKRVNFLYTAAHAVAAAQPNLARSYL